MTGSGRRVGLLGSEVLPALVLSFLCGAASVAVAVWLFVTANSDDEDY